MEVNGSNKVGSNTAPSVATATSGALLLSGKNIVFLKGMRGTTLPLNEGKSCQNLNEIFSLKGERIDMTYRKNNPPKGDILALEKRVTF